VYLGRWLKIVDRKTVEKVLVVPLQEIPEIKIYRKSDKAIHGCAFSDLFLAFHGAVGGRRRFQRARSATACRFQGS